jgi:predicted GIY-YIG superfamily endonuclease
MSARYVYRCYQQDGRLVYVGCTINLADRLAAHRSGAHWAQLVTRVVAVVLPKDEAFRIEAAAIVSERPRFNVKGRWKTRPGWTLADYDDYLTALRHGPEAHAPGARRHAQKAQLLRDTFAAEATAA